MGKIWDNAKCKSTYGSTAPAGITETMLCAGKQGKDSCSGDSGGPFVIPKGDHWEQIGVVSWGIGCGKQHYPGVYTRVSHMMEWINKVRRLYPGPKKKKTGVTYTTNLTQQPSYLPVTIYRARCACTILLPSFQMADLKSLHNYPTYI